MHRNYASPFPGSGGLPVVGPISQWRMVLRPGCRHPRLVMEEVVWPEYRKVRKCARCGRQV
jgi:hypothetical protein